MQSGRRHRQYLRCVPLMSEGADGALSPLHSMPPKTIACTEPPAPAGLQDGSPPERWRHCEASARGLSDALRVESTPKGMLSFGPSHGATKPCSRQSPLLGASAVCGTKPRSRLPSSVLDLGQLKKKTSAFRPGIRVQHPPRCTSAESQGCCGKPLAAFRSFA